MQKKIIALAIASALTAPAVAMAETGGNVSLYGQANLSVDMVNDGKAASGKSNNLVSNASRIGFKGSEDLGGGLTAVFQMEKEVNVDNGSPAKTTDKSVVSAAKDLAGDAMFDRNTYIGVASADMGTVLFGRHDTPYKISTRGLDLFADSTADNRSHIMSAHDTRLNNVIAYISPSFGGLTIAAASVFGAEGAASADTKGTAISLAGMYSAGGIFGSLAYQGVKWGSVGDLVGTVNDENKAFKLGGGYTMDAITVNAVVEKTTVKVSAVDTTGTNLYLGGKYALSATDAVKLAYGKKGDTTAAGVKTVNNVKQVSLGYDHDMSKRTSVYALYTKITDNVAQTATTGNDPSTVSIGMKHAF